MVIRNGVVNEILCELVLVFTGLDDLADVLELTVHVFGILRKGEHNKRVLWGDFV